WQDRIGFARIAREREQDLLSASPSHLFYAREDPRFGRANRADQLKKNGIVSRNNWQVQIRPSGIDGKLLAKRIVGQKPGGSLYQCDREIFLDGHHQGTRHSSANADVGDLGMPSHARPVRREIVPQRSESVDLEA